MTAALLQEFRCEGKHCSLGPLASIIKHYRIRIANESGFNNIRGTSGKVQRKLVSFLLRDFSWESNVANTTGNAEVSSMHTGS